MDLYNLAEYMNWHNYFPKRFWKWLLNHYDSKIYGSTIICIECEIYPVDLPDSICQGCKE